MPVLLSRRQIWSSPVRYVRVDYEMGEHSASSLQVRFKVYYELKITSSESGSGYKTYFRAKLNGSAMGQVQLKGTSPYQWEETIVKFSPGSTGWHTVMLSEGAQSVDVDLVFSCDDPADQTKTYNAAITFPAVSSVPEAPVMVSAACEESRSVCHYATPIVIDAVGSEAGLDYVLYKSVNEAEFIPIDEKETLGSAVQFTYIPEEKSGDALCFAVSAKRSEESAEESAYTQSNTLRMSGVYVGAGGEIRIATPYVGTPEGIRRVKKVLVGAQGQIRTAKS